MTGRDLSPDDLAALEAAQATARRTYQEQLERVPVLRPLGVPSALRGLPAPRWRQGENGPEVETACACKALFWKPFRSQHAHCPACVERQRAAEMAKRCDDMREEVMARVPSLARGLAFGGPDLARWVRDRAACDKAHKLALALPKVVLLVGGTGAGKTSLAAAMWHAQLAALRASTATERDLYWAKGMCWAHARSLSVARRETPLGRAVNPVDAAKEASLLVLDDLGQETVADKDDLVDVLQHRFAERLPTIATCGFKPETLRERYEHIVRRLTEDKEALVQVHKGGVTG